MPSLVSAFLNSRGPQRLGLCADDVPRNCSFINQATEELLNKAGEDGWADGWDRVVFNVTRGDPYLTSPPQFSRIIAMNVCRAPIRIQNAWYETLVAGIGLRSPCADSQPNGCCGALEAYSRPNVPTAYDLTSTNQKLRVYITDARDVGKRILFTDAKDQNGNGVYSQGGQYNVIGFYLQFQNPFVTSDFIITAFSAVFKDETYGDVILMQVDATTGTERLLARYTPKMINPTYRRYLVGALPDGCCTDNTPSTPAQVTCMCKLGFQQVGAPTDRLLVGNIPALIEMCASIRHREVDRADAKALAISEEAKAVSLLNQELETYNGKIQPAINLAVFGTAILPRQRIGTLW